MPDAMKALNRSVMKFRMNQLREKTDINRNKNQGNLVFSLSVLL